MRTPDEIVCLMLQEMPYVLNANAVTYIIEAVTIAQNEARNEAINDVLRMTVTFADNLTKLKK